MLSDMPAASDFGAGLEEPLRANLRSKPLHGTKKTRLLLQLQARRRSAMRPSWLTARRGTGTPNRARAVCRLRGVSAPHPRARAQPAAFPRGD